MGTRGAVTAPLPVAGFCRDCLEAVDARAARCRHCGSPRLLRHHALSSLAIAHIDCDAFYATVEKRDNPELADKPVAIGGGKRGVVSAACYVARTYGVRSAMPMFKAHQLCPELVVVKPDMSKYVRVGREVRRAMQALTPLVEPLSIDEAFLDLSGTERIHGAIPALTLARFARDVQREIGITVSVGLSCNKFLAKVASDLDKPRGFAVLDQEDGCRPACEQAGELHLWRRACDPAAAAATGLSADLGFSARRRERADEAVRPGGPQAVAARARHRQPKGRARPRHESHLRGNDLRDRLARRLRAWSAFSGN